MRSINTHRYVIPENLLYSENHVWAQVKNEVIVIGITDFLQKLLETIIGVYFPSCDLIEKGSPIAWLESIKAVVAVLSPINCELMKTNTRLREKPYIINIKPYEEGWIAMVKVSNQDELRAFKSAESYARAISALSRCEPCQVS